MLRQTSTQSGLVRGIPAADPRITAYLGIPFAAPPVGENRWRAPQPPSSWDGVRACDRMGPLSMQFVPQFNGPGLYDREWHVDAECPMDEDCLYLNIWTPAMNADERMPVLVWYFGGGLQCGSPNEMEFDGERIARRGIVVVTINYRTNCFGFLCHPDITKEAPDAPANFGHLDQIAATRWVQRNIHSFGGDPKRVTIAGQSAGGGSVQSVLVSPLGKDICQGAIIESGLFESIYHPVLLTARTLAQGEAQGVEFFKYLGVETLAQARALDAKYVRDKMLESKKFFGCVVDGKFATDIAWKQLLRGEYDDIPVMTGYTEDEFHDSLRGETTEALKEEAKACFGENADEFLRLCGGQTAQDIRANSNVGIVEIACRMLAKQRAKQGKKTWVYRFDPDIPGWDDPGAFHSCDLWFFFETLAKCWRPFKGVHYDLARQMCNAWAHFIKTGDPNGSDADGTPQPEWKPYADGDFVMSFDQCCHCDQSTQTPIKAFLTDACLARKTEEKR